MLSDWGETQKPDVFTWKNVGWAVVVHLVFFALCWLLSIPLPNKEIAIPIDLTVVVNENLDGDPDEPPPEAPPVKQPEPPPPAPEPKPEPEPPAPPPPPPVEVKQDAVIKEPEKKIEKKPEKTKEELEKERKKKQEERKKKLEERKKKMLESVQKQKTIKDKTEKKPKQPTREDRLKAMRDALNDGTPPKYNGKTDKRPDNWQELLNQGYRPGAKTQLATSENQRCISLIKAKFDKSWEQVGIPPWTDTLREMHLSLKFSSTGKILSYSLSQSSSDRRVDSTVLQAAKLMNAVYGLSPEFLESNGGNVTIKVKVRPK